MLNKHNILPRLWALDEEALGLVYDRFQPKLYRYAYRLLGNVEMAEDVVAETFLRLLQALHRNRGPKQHLQAWLYRVAHNLIVDRYRRRPAQEPLSLEQATLRGTNAPAKEVEHILAQDQIRQALRELTPDQRQVIVLKFLEGFKNQEVATILDKTVGAVKSLQYRALASLQRVLETSSARSEESS